MRAAARQQRRKLKCWERTYRHGDVDVTIHIRERPGSAVLQADFYVRGRRLQVSTKERDLEAAAAAGWRLYLKHDGETPEIPIAAEYRLLSHWAADDVERAEDLGLHADTINAYEAAAGNLLRVLGALLRVRPGTVELDQVTPNVLQDYVRQRRREPRRAGTETPEAAVKRTTALPEDARRYVSAKTISKELTCLRRWYERARGDSDVRCDRKLLDSVDYLLAAWPKSLEASPVDQGRRAHVRDLETLRSAVDLAGVELRELLIVEHCTGLRAEEMFKIRGAWLRRRRLHENVPGYLEVPPTDAKASSDVAVVPLVAEAFEIIAKRVDGGRDLIFERNDYHRQELEEISAKLGLEHRLKLKDLRRCFGTAVVDLTSSLHAAKEALRHASVTTTERHYVSLQAKGALEAAVALAPRMTAWLQIRSDSAVSPEQGSASQVPAVPEEFMVSEEGVEPTTNGLRVHGQSKIHRLFSTSVVRALQPVAGGCRPQPLQSQLQSAHELLEACGGDLEAAISVLRVAGGAA